MKHVYLTVAEIVAMHAILIRRYGGAAEMRDAGALDGALFRPQSGYYDNLAAEAAALFESLITSHPFVDGNRRVAFAATDTFLRMNGFCISGAPAAIYRELMDMFGSRTLDIAHLEPWLRALVEPI